MNNHQTKWNRLEEMERRKLSAELTHCLQNDDLFEILCKIVNRAKENGVFDKVIMFPDYRKEKLIY